MNTEPEAPNHRPGSQPTSPAGNLEETLCLWTGRFLVAPGVADPPPEVAPDAIRSFAARHGIGPLLARTLQSVQGSSTLLSGFDAKTLAAEDMARTHEFARVVEAFREHLEHPVLVFKGQALAFDLYPHPWLRPRGDVDILVGAGDYTAATRLLQQLDYEPALSVDGDLVITQSSFRRVSTNLEHVWDVHHRISNRPMFADVLSYEELSSNAVKLRAAQTSFRAPGRVDALLIACLHLVGHHMNEIRLIWLYDIHLLAQSLSETEYPLLIDKARAGPRLAAACHAALALTQRYLPSERTEVLTGELDPGPGGRWRIPRSYFARLKEDMRAVNASDKVRLIKQHAFPSGDYMVQRFAVQHRWQLPFWYTFRSFRALAKLFLRR